MANYIKRDERAVSSPRPRSKPGPPPTLGQELRGGYRWFWFVCPRCNRRTPKALAPFAILYGMNVPTINIARLATCQRCGHFGALLQRPSMEGIGSDMGLEEFRAELATQGLERLLARVAHTLSPAALRANTESYRG